MIGINQDNKKKIFLLIITLIVGCSNVAAHTSIILQAEGTSALGDDKTRKETEIEALESARRSALEQAGVYIRSETETKNFMLDHDLIEAYTRGTVKVLDTMDSTWYDDPDYGLSYRIRIKAEVIPDLEGIQEELVTKEQRQKDATELDPRAPLTVRLWTSRESYGPGDRMKIYIRGNKPFFGRVIYKNAKGEFLQILPNPYREENYFNGGTTYELPSGEDSYELVVSEPFGEEEVILFASTAPLGAIQMTDNGPVFTVSEKLEDIEVKSRGLQLQQKGKAGQITGAEFCQKDLFLDIRK